MGLSKSTRYHNWRLTLSFRLILKLILGIIFVSFYLETNKTLETLWRWSEDTFPLNSGRSCFELNSFYLSLFRYKWLIEKQDMLRRNRCYRFSAVRLLGVFFWFLHSIILETCFQMIVSFLRFAVILKFWKSVKPLWSYNVKQILGSRNVDLKLRVNKNLSLNIHDTERNQIILNLKFELDLKVKFLYSYLYL